MYADIEKVFHNNGFSQDFVIGQQDMDQEHARIAHALTELRGILETGAVGEEIARQMAAIVVLARGHFQTEEALFQRYGYPHAENHRAEHGQFLSEITILGKTLERETDHLRRAALVNLFLFDWLRNHVGTHDRAFVQFLRHKQFREAMPLNRLLLNLFRRHLEEALGEAFKHIHALFLPWRHSELIMARRAALIVSRVRLLAGLFALLTPTWILVDFLFFPAELASRLAVARLLATAGFAGLSLVFRRTENILIAYISIGLLFIIPTLFFMYTNFLFTDSAQVFSAMSANLVTGYAFLPFVMAAGISIFPFTALEGVVMALPGLLAEFFTGHFSLSFHNDPGSYGTLWLLMLIAGVATLAGMSQLHFWIEIISKSSHDPLTRVYNRASGQELMEKYVHMARRNQGPLCLFFFDIDNFKSINDVYGHEAGDETLQTLAQALLRVTRKEDVVVRWGGEEFLVLTPLSRQEDCQAILGRICQHGALGKRPDGFPLTASVGMAELLGDRAESLAQLIALADHRMYRAKKSGKNRVCYGDGEQAMTPGGIF